MSASWIINTTPVEDMDLRLVGGLFRIGAPSVMRLESSRPFDGAEQLSYGAAVALRKSEGGTLTTYFQGKVTAVPKGGSESDEYQLYEVEDAWAELETTIYQESWGLGAGSVIQPKFVFGIVPNVVEGGFDYADAGAQIAAVIRYAITQGINLQLGSVPTGARLLPTEMANVFCSEVIMQALKIHPDWIPWIDHSTSPPTFNVTKLSEAAVASIAVDGTGDVGDFVVIKRDDLLPESVRIVYEFATTIDDLVYRNIVIDKYPAEGPDGGPKVLQASVALAGMKMQIQKSRIKTRTIPASQETAKDWIRLKYPYLKDLTDDDFNVTAWAKELILDEEAEPDPISTQAPRLAVDSVEDVPRELLKGTIEDWMRRKVGRVRITPKIKATGDASDEAKEAIKKGTPPVTVTATNAVTKLYRGISQWVPPEDIPTGIAEQTYQAIYSSMPYQGQIPTKLEDVVAVRLYGKKLRITGGEAGWATMDALIYSVDFDIESGITTVSFGPVPHLAPTDFIELQRMLRQRPVTWWSLEERESSLLGAENDPSALGDTVAGYDQPENSFEPLVSALTLGFMVLEVVEGEGGFEAKVAAGVVYGRNSKGTGAPISTIVVPEGDYEVTAADKLYLRVQTDQWDFVHSAAVVVASSTPDTTHAQPPPAGNDGDYHYLLADFETVDEAVVVANQYHVGLLVHHQGRNNRNLKMRINEYFEDTDGKLFPAGTEGKFLYWRDGLYVGKTDPGDGAAQDEETFMNLVEES